MRTPARALCLSQECAGWAGFVKASMTDYAEILRVLVAGIMQQ
jgi:hypothetical protein